MNSAYLKRTLVPLMEYSVSEMVYDGPGGSINFTLTDLPVPGTLTIQNIASPFVAFIDDPSDSSLKPMFFNIPVSYGSVDYSTGSCSLSYSASRLALRARYYSMNKLLSQLPTPIHTESGHLVVGANHHAYDKIANVVLSTGFMTDDNYTYYAHNYRARLCYSAVSDGQDGLMGGSIIYEGMNPIYESDKMRSGKSHIRVARNSDVYILPMIPIEVIEHDS